MNIKLNSDPEITFFRFLFKRYTNFALENQSIEFTGGSSLGSGRYSQVRLNRSGDLVHHMYIIIDLPGIANVSTEKQMGYGADDNTVGGYVEIVESEAEAERYKGLKTNGQKSNCAVPETACTFKHAGQTEVDGRGVPYWTKAVGQFLIEQCTILIGSQPIDSLYSDYLYMYEELTHKPGRRLTEMIGKHSDPSVAKMESKFFRRLYVPLPFFFTKTSGNALPLVSLQFHDVAVKVKWEDVKRAVVNMCGEGTSVTCKKQNAAGEDVVTTFQTVVRPGEDRMKTSCQHGALKLFGSHTQDAQAKNKLQNSHVSARLEVCYIYLDVDERAKFSDAGYEMLISEVQALPVTTDHRTANCKVPLHFNHTVFEVMWAVRQHVAVLDNRHFDYSGVKEPLTGKERDPVSHVSMRLNNQNRIYPTEGRYFRLVQPYQHHSNVPDSFVYSYSFALHPEDAQPSGTCNFSRIDNASLDLTLDTAMFHNNTMYGGTDLTSESIPGGNHCSVLCYGRNWNILRITLGLAGKAFAN